MTTRRNIFRLAVCAVAAFVAGAKNPDLSAFPKTNAKMWKHYIPPVAYGKSFMDQEWHCYCRGFWTPRYKTMT